MSNVEKEEKVLEVKRIRDLTDEDFENEEVVKDLNFSGVSCTYNKKAKRYMYTLEIHFINNKIVKRIALTSQQYNIICACAGLAVDPTKEAPLTRIYTKVRFLKGYTTEGNEYRSYQLFPVMKNNLDISRNSIYFNDFVDDALDNEFKIFGIYKKINYKLAPLSEEVPVSLEDINY